jgi:hypothetical protein
MEIYLLIVALGLFLANVSMFFLIRRLYGTEKQKLLLVLRAYFEPRGDNEPSEFASLVDGITEKFAQRLLLGFKGSVMGMQSVDSKNVARLEADVAQDTVTQQNPALGMFLQQYPSVANRLSKNPQLLPLIQGLMSRMGSAGRSSGNSSSGRGSTDDLEIK